MQASRGECKLHPIIRKYGQQVWHLPRVLNMAIFRSPEEDTAIYAYFF